MTHYPILFSRRAKVEASNYTAGVILAGRILVTDEDGEFWAEGINPGGVAAKGASVAEALQEFCIAYNEVLLDIASDEPTFAGFEKAVEQFFRDTSMAALRDWDAAVLEVRAGRVTVEDMPLRPAELPVEIQVLLLQYTSTSGQEVGDSAMAA